MSVYIPEIDNRAYAEVYGYNPLDEYNETHPWHTERRANLAPMVDAQIGYDSMVKQNEQNRALAQYQNEYNTMMWDRQNEYNSPEATIQRLVSAGVNPRAYNQVGQFANSASPQPASSYDYKEPMSETAKYVESETLKLQRKQYRLENLKLMNEILDETFQYKLNSDRNDEVFRHNQAMEGAKSIQLMLDDDKFRVDLAKHGIVYDPETRAFTVPTNYIGLDERTKLQVLENLKKTGVKLDTEQEYLELKKTLETMNTGNAMVDTILRVLIKLI